MKMLSLKAPSNWVRKNGRKRLVPSRLNCECGVIVHVPDMRAVQGRENRERRDARPALDCNKPRQSHRER
ncbi:hypothetical protein D3C84_1136160 [compost metagenome]